MAFIRVGLGGGVYLFKRALGRALKYGVPTVVVLEFVDQHRGEISRIADSVTEVGQLNIVGVFDQVGQRGTATVGLPAGELAELPPMWRRDP